jgi:hypothetical protein
MNSIAGLPMFKIEVSVTMGLSHFAAEIPWAIFFNAPSIAMAAVISGKR